MHPLQHFRHGTGSPRPRATGRFRSLVAMLATFIMACTALVASGTAAQAADPDNHVMATWNMQVGRDRWAGAYTLAGLHDVVALQEVPAQAPEAADYQDTINGIDHYLWREGSRGYERHLYILRPGGNSRNLGMITSWPADNVVAINSVYRPALGVVNTADGTLFASLHAASDGGNDGGALLRRIATAAANIGLPSWVALGDFNRDPAQLPALTPPPNYLIYNSGQATQRSGGELDYVVSNVRTHRWQATVLPNPGSDHWPVRFGVLRARADVTIHAQNSGLLLDVYRAQSDNGTHVIQYEADSGDNQLWFLTPVSGTSIGYYRIHSKPSGKCLDVNRGQSSGAGDYLNIWDCHTEGSDWAHDTQTFELEHAVATMPNLWRLRNYATGMYANIYDNQTSGGTWVIQWPDQRNGSIPVPNETFYLHSGGSVGVTASKSSSPSTLAPLGVPLASGEPTGK